MELNEKKDFPSHSGALFEKLVLKHSKKIFEKSGQWKTVGVDHPIFNRNQKRSSIYNTCEEDENSKNNGKSGSKKKPLKSSDILWWEPPDDNLAVEFCQETSTHGLKFLSSKKRHISERIFWIIAFCFGLAAAVTLINDVWRRYKQNPVIVSFQPKDQDIDSIPFPAVTFCNMNKFPKSKIEELERIAKAGPDEKTRKQAATNLIYARSVCNAQQSFAQLFNYAAKRGASVSENDTIDDDDQDEMLEFLLDNTIECKELIRLCIFGENQYKCDDLLKPIVTDYGKCCTFNILPIRLLLKNPNESVLDKPIDQIGSVEGAPVTPKPNQNTTILVDANLNEYYCPASDSEGFRYILHAPLEMPHVMEYAGILELGKETYVEINPEVTNADDEIRKFDRKERQCFFGNERTLAFFQPYTGANCIDECTALVITKQCNCSFFYMPRFDETKICNNDERSKDAICIRNAKIGLLDTLKDDCGHCDSLCEDIAYHSQTSVSNMQSPDKLWNDPDPNSNLTVPKWANNKMSIVHIYFGSESTVPKLRKRLYGDVDLIANTGGLLGLCLGVSVLSAIEGIYYFTIRAFWKYCYRRRKRQKVAKKFVEILKKKVKTGKPERVVNLDPSSLPFYPANGTYGSFQPGYKNEGRGFKRQYGFKNEAYE